MNPRLLGLIREFLAALAAALICYGYGSDALWQESTGGVIALVTLVWGIRSNTGKEAWYSLGRKVLSSVAGVLVITGTLSPDKANVLIGLACTVLSMAWSLNGKDGNIPPAVPMIAFLLGLSVLLPSCAPTITIKSTAPDGTITETTTKGGVDHEALGVTAQAALAATTAALASHSYHGPVVDQHGKN